MQRYPRHVRTLVVCVLVPLAAAWPLTAVGAPGPGPVRGPTPTLSWTARVLIPVEARVAPRRTARRVLVLQPTAPLAGGPTALLVTGTVRTHGGGSWVRLLLPVRPNGTQGWVPASTLRFVSTRLRLLIDQGDRRLTLFRRGRQVMSVPVAVGAPSTPTPTGRFAVAEMIRTRTPGAFLGPVVFPLTGFSETLNEYAGGNGRFAVHGTSVPQFLGTRASHGCVRVGNSEIVRLSRLVRPGTPVTIRW